MSVCGGGRGVEVRRRYTLYGDHCPPAKSGMHGTGVFRKHNGWGNILCVYIQARIQGGAKGALAPPPPKKNFPPNNLRQHNSQARIQGGAKGALAPPPT